MSVLAELLGAMSAAPPMPEAACRGQWALFDMTVPEGAGRLPAAVTEARRTAIETCRGCPELSACQLWLDGLEATQKPLGVVAGIVIDRRRAKAVA